MAQQELVADPFICFPIEIMSAIVYDLGLRQCLECMAVCRRWARWHYLMDNGSIQVA